MVSLLKNTTTHGLYIIEEQGGSIAANTPGEIDLDSLTEGTDYIYIEDITSYGKALGFMKKGDNQYGWEVIGLGAGKTQKLTYGDDERLIQFTFECTEAQKELIEPFGVKNNSFIDAQKYLVWQHGATDFEQYPNATGTNKNYAPVIVLGCEIKWNPDSLFSFRTGMMMLREVWG